MFSTVVPRDDDLLRFRLRRHPVGRMHSRTEYVVLLLHNRAEMAAHRESRPELRSSFIVVRRNRGSAS